MRGPLAIALVLLLAGLSGCVSLVEDDPDAQAAVAEAEQAIDDYAAKTGHIAGTITSGTDGLAVTTASVDVTGVATDLVADAQGRFVILDLAPGTYELLVSAPGFLEQSLAVSVAAGQFSRPEVVLAPVPAPQAYYTTMRMDAFAEFGTLFGTLSCACSMSGELDPEGLTGLLVEAVLGDANAGPSADSFQWSLETSNATDDWAYAGGYSSAPLRALVPLEDIVPAADEVYLSVEPYAGALPYVDQAFTAYLSAFYYGPVPEDFTAVGADE